MAKNFKAAYKTIMDDEFTPGPEEVIHVDASDHAPVVFLHAW